MAVRIHTIDLDYLGTPGSIAAYLLEGGGDPVLVETGPASTVAALERGIRRLGHRVGEVRHVLLTHIHFDHAGAAGWMARHGAQVYVHAFGAKHLIDPDRLIASARRIYGDGMEERWGEMEPVPAGRVTAVHDGDALEFDGLRLRALETPGHARHHHAFVLETGEGRLAFTGDAAGTFIAACPRFVAIPMPPPEFDLTAWLASLRRLDRAGLDRIYPTHFGPLDEPGGHLARVGRAVREHAEYIRDLLRQERDMELVTHRYTRWFLDAAADAGVPEGKLDFYIRDTIAAMNVMGVARYWQQQSAL